MIDIFMTTKGRPEIFRRSLLSFNENTDSDAYRLTIIDDTGDGDTVVEDILRNTGFKPDRFIKHWKNMGLGPSINEAISVIDSEWQKTEFICYVQDDLIYSPFWLPMLLSGFRVHEERHRIGFATGHECVEHPTHLRLSKGEVLKKSIRASQMLARREYWTSMYPIPEMDPETGRLRAKPNDGIGSGVDWHFIRNHDNSVWKTGRNCLVIPGLVQHIGYADSTWLKRELPESSHDLEVMRKA